MTDQELIAAIKAGDQAAISEVIVKYNGMLQGMARKFGVKEDVDDLVQDTFIRAIQRIDTFRGDKASFSSWLVTILHSIMINKVRANKVIDKHVMTLEDAPETHTHHDALDQIIAKETYAKIVAALSPRDLGLIKQRVSGYSWDDIAQRSGKNIVSIRVRYNRIRNKLREVLGGV